MEEIKRVIIIANGEVQKVGYRDVVQKIARKFGVTGYVENLEIGDVKIVIEGEREKLENFINRIKIKDELIEVKDISVTWSGPTNEFSDFKKIVKEKETDERLDSAVEQLKKLIVVTKGGFDDLSGKQDQMLGKQDQMLGKQDQMIDKQDQTIKVLGSKIDSGNKIIVEKLDTFHKDTTQNFGLLDVKYGEISKNLVRAVEGIEKMLEKSEKDRQDFRDSIKELAEAIRNRG